MCSAAETSPTAGAAPTLLDAHETDSHRSDGLRLGKYWTTVSALDVAWRHAGWQPHRQRIYDAMRCHDYSASRVHRFATCGSHAWVLQSLADPADLRVAASYCHDRFCVPCARAAAGTITRNLCHLLPGRRLRFITLTLRHSQEPLASQVQHLWGSFSRLRRSELWSAAVTGGIAICEVKRSRDRHSWHPHLHILVEGRYLPQSDLSRAWHRITGHSYIVHITAVRDPDASARYVAKYAAKPMSSSFRGDQAGLSEALSALAHIKLIRSFGSWRGWPLYQPEPSTPSRPIASLQSILWASARNDPTATRLLQQLTQGTSCPITLATIIQLHSLTPRSPPQCEHTVLPTVPVAAPF